MGAVIGFYGQVCQIVSRIIVNDGFLFQNHGVFTFLADFLDNINHPFQKFTGHFFFFSGKIFVLIFNITLKPDFFFSEQIFFFLFQFWLENKALLV